MHSNLRIAFLLLVSIAFFFGCEKEITVDLPEAGGQIVVEGSIEQGQPPIIFLTRSQGYFEPIDLNGLASLIIRDAIVTVGNGTSTVELTEICASELTEEQLPLVAELTGFTPEELAQADICVYSTFDQSVWGEPNRIYDLRIEVGDEVVTSRTKINTPIPLDSLWFEIPGEDPEDSLGFIYGILTDPDTIGNAYRWFAKRENRYPEWSQYAGDFKDESYIAPLGSAIDDLFFNGLSFEFGYFRGTAANSTKVDDFNEEAGFFKLGDTVAVRGTVIDRAALAFITAMEDQAAGQGSPFANPANIPSNIEGGLGAWIGYGAVYDTVICVP